MECSIVMELVGGHQAGGIGLKDAADEELGHVVPVTRLPAAEKISFTLPSRGASVLAYVNVLAPWDKGLR
jgi:hypothetical protein